MLLDFMSDDWEIAHAGSWEYSQGNGIENSAINKGQEKHCNQVLLDHHMLIILIYMRYLCLYYVCRTMHKEHGHMLDFMIDHGNLGRKDQRKQFKISSNFVDSSVSGTFHDYNFVCS